MRYTLDEAIAELGDHAGTLVCRLDDAGIRHVKINVIAADDAEFWAQSWLGSRQDWLTRTRNLLYERGYGELEWRIVPYETIANPEDYHPAPALTPRDDS